MNNENFNTELENVSSFDLAAIAIDQPRGWKGLVAKTIVFGIGIKLTSMAIDAVVNKVKEIRSIRTAPKANLHKVA